MLKFNDFYPKMGVFENLIKILYVYILPAGTKKGGFSAPKKMFFYWLFFEVEMRAILGSGLFFLMNIYELIDI